MKEVLPDLFSDFCSVVFDGVERQSSSDDSFNICFLEAADSLGFSSSISVTNSSTPTDNFFNFRFFEAPSFSPLLSSTSVSD